MGQRDLLRTKLDDQELNQVLVDCWGALVDNQLTRLNNLLTFREGFISWSKEAQQIISGKEKRPSITTLNLLASKSLRYPSGKCFAFLFFGFPSHLTLSTASEIVQKIRSLSDRANRWKEMAAQRLNCDQKVTMQEATVLFDEGEKLGINFDLLKTLRSALRSAKSWLNRVKRSKFEKGETCSSDIEELIEEHNALDLSLPNEVQKLKQAMKGYCICRRPYEGFMIGCDGCEEWYHGCCIGVSEAQAERFEKYLCARCSVEKVFSSSANTLAFVVRKWTCPKDLKKSRQNEYQKH
jgi:hypothetical protein